MPQIVKNLPVTQKPGFNPWQGRSPEKEIAPLFLPGEFHGERNLACYSPRDHKESDMSEQLTCSLSVT